MYIKIAQNMLKGQTILRIMMNYSLVEYGIYGRVVDVGGGRFPDYYDYMKVTPGTVIIPIDGSISGINLEKDFLPETDGTTDFVICCNVLEHIYNYQFLVGEMKRILKPRGQLIGFVPFLINYHPR